MWVIIDYLARDCGVTGGFVILQLELIEISIKNMYI